MGEIAAFLAVADELHFGRAAQRLHVSTARVSQTIKSLERQVGGALFERTSRRVSLTPLGLTLLAEFRPAYDRLQHGLQQGLQASRQQAGQQGRQAGQQGRQDQTGPDVLRAGFSMAIDTQVRDRVIGAFGRAAPDCHLVRMELPSFEQLRHFERGEFPTDVLLCWLPDPDRAAPPVPGWVAVGTIVLRRQRAAVMRSDHPLAGRGVIDVEDLAGYQVVRPWGYPPCAAAWTPGQTPRGLPIGIYQQKRQWYTEEIPVNLAESNLIHLTFLPGPPTCDTRDLAVLPVTGMPPVGCAVLWAKNDPNPLIATFNKAAATSTVAGSTGTP
jgi:DNA-binding transcriptional LysR family regulator